MEDNAILIIIIAVIAIYFLTKKDNAVTPKKPISVVCLGDSLTQSYPCHELIILPRIFFAVN